MELPSRGLICAMGEVKRALFRQSLKFEFYYTT